jgi:hypothetical protein
MATSKSSAPKVDEQTADPNDPFGFTMEERHEADTSFPNLDQWAERDEAAEGGVQSAPPKTTSEYKSS